jgi:hypothetical protein
MKKLVCESLSEFYGKGYVSTPTFGNTESEDIDSKKVEEPEDIYAPEPEDEKKGTRDKSETKAWKVLNFIKEAGNEGVTLQQIQYFIWTKLNGKNPEQFFEKSTDYSGKQMRQSRGYWNTHLYGDGTYKGLLPTYCKKNEKGKWVIAKMPGKDENIYLPSDSLNTYMSHMRKYM